MSSPTLEERFPKGATVETWGHGRHGRMGTVAGHAPKRIKVEYDDGVIRHVSTLFIDVVSDPKGPRHRETEGQRRKPDAPPGSMPGLGAGDGAAGSSPAGSTETLEEWAARKALRLKREDWRIAEVIAGNKWEPACRTWLEGAFSTNPPDTTGLKLARALLAFRGKVVAGLELDYRCAVSFYPQLPADSETRGGLEDCELLDLDHNWTPLGHEVARVLRGEASDA